ncbi:MAG: winged helix-turn-helix domain-containing protein, partial [Terriglobales bacterium]
MMEINGSDRLRFGAYEADLHTHELWKHGTRIKLVGQPFEILAVLVKRPGQLVTREELRAELWPGDTFVDFNHGLNAAVNKLRDALCDSADDPKYIETLPRRGYRFIAEVEQAVSPRIAELATAENPGRPASTAQALLPKTVTLNGDVAEVAGVEAVSAFEPSQLPSKSLPWLRYT